MQGRGRQSRVGEGKKGRGGERGRGGDWAVKGKGLDIWPWRGEGNGAGASLGEGRGEGSAISFPTRFVSRFRNCRDFLLIYVLF